MKRLENGKARNNVLCHVVKPQAVHRVLSSLWTTLQIPGPNNRDFTPWEGDFEPSTLGLCPSEVSASYLHATVFSKLDDGKPSSAKEEETWRRFYAAEEQCRITNERLRYPQSLYSLKRTGPWSLIEGAREKIADLLGPLDWNFAAKHMAWGPGSSTRLPRRHGDAAFKYSGNPETTIENAILADAAIAAFPLWQESLEHSEEGIGYCKIVPGNCIIAVAKNYKTNRAIAVEPCMNMYIQKGLGGVIRGKLRAVGVDLNDQTKNQRLALIGSLAGTLATIDLKMASDTVSYEIVRRLLPPDWFEALEQCRSAVGVLPSGEVIRYQKFSSMGNGYTFELESLIFWALIQSVLDAHRVRDRRFAVYGDDLVISNEAAEPLLGLLSVCGFTPNADKSFVKGPFRESCGKHFYLGNDVSPFYVKRPVMVLTDLFLLHNQIYRWCGRVSLSYDTAIKISVLLGRIRNLAPARWRKQLIPDGVGDGAFIGSFEEVCPKRAPRTHKYFTHEGFLVRSLVPVAEVMYPDIVGMLIKAVHDVRGPWSWEPNHLIRSSLSEVIGSIPESTAGVSQAPRLREVKTLVLQFSSASPFAEFGL